MVDGDLRHGQALGSKLLLSGSGSGCQAMVGLSGNRALGL